jgi:phosphatidylglycerophosphate synthase
MSSQQDYVKIIPSPLERSVDRFATFLVPAVPQGIRPNHITGIGFMAGLVVALSFYLASFDPVWFWIAAIALVIHMVADSLDGAVARPLFLSL